MPKFTEKKTLPYSPKQVFSVVCDVAKYPDFLPWCVGARIFAKKENQFDADVIIGFKMFRERFTSRVTLVPHEKVYVDYIKGPMKRLYNHWHFIEQEDGSCLIDFEVDFEFKSKLLDDMIGTLFGKACEKMVAAFEERVQELYG